MTLLINNALPTSTQLAAIRVDLGLGVGTPGNPNGVALLDGAGDLPYNIMPTNLASTTLDTDGKIVSLNTDTQTTNITNSYSLCQSAIPLIMPSSGTILANGMLTLKTALYTTYSSGCYMYFPVGAIGVGVSLGMYFVIMTSTTQGKIFNNRIIENNPTIPKVLTPFVGTNGAVYTQTIGLFTWGNARHLLDMMMPANIMGNNGSVEVHSLATYSNLHGLVQYGWQINNQNVMTSGSIGTSITNGDVVVSTLRNRGVTDSQFAISAYDPRVQNTNDVSNIKYLNVDTSMSTNITLWANLGNDLDFFVLESYKATVYPKNVSPTVNLISAPVLVPPKYVGMSSANALVPTGVVCETVRSWDYYGSMGWPNRCTMNILNPSASVYMWKPLDDLLGNAPTKQIVMVLGQPADYLVTRAAVGGAYLLGKANMCPDNLSAWATAVTAVVTRTKNTWNRTGLIWELWNEIDGVEQYGDDIALLGAYTRVTAQAIKAVDPTAIISAPSIYGIVDKFVSWANASDGVGGHAKDWVTVGNYHSYENYALGITGGQYSPSALVTHWNEYQSGMKKVGVNWPVYITEAGYTFNEPQQAIDHTRAMITLAALGAQTYIGYDFDDTQYFGIQGMATQWNNAANLLRQNAVITSLVVGTHSVTVVINGISYTF